MAEERTSRTAEQWKKILTPSEYEVCIKHGTEPPFSGLYNDSKKSGAYLCKCCGEALFSSGAKFDSRSGWPSFWEPVDEKKIEYVRDVSFGMVRVEVNCNQCGAHLGHVFDDGPMPTNQRYCINSVSLLHEGDKEEDVKMATGPGNKDSD